MLFTLLVSSLEVLILFHVAALEALRGGDTSNQTNEAAHPAPRFLLQETSAQVLYEVG